MKFTTALLLAFSAALAIAFPNPVADATPEFSSDLQRRGDYQTAGCRKDTNACVFTNVKIVCDPATPCTDDYALCTVYSGEDHGGYANCT